MLLPFKSPNLTNEENRVIAILNVKTGFRKWPRDYQQLLMVMFCISIRFSGYLFYIWLMQFWAMVTICRIQCYVPCISPPSISDQLKSKVGRLNKYVRLQWLCLHFHFWNRVCSHSSCRGVQKVVIPLPFMVFDTVDVNDFIRWIYQCHNLTISLYLVTVGFLCRYFRSVFSIFVGQCHTIQPQLQSQDIIQ